MQPLLLSAMDADTSDAFGHVEASPARHPCEQEPNQPALESAPEPALEPAVEEVGGVRIKYVSTPPPPELSWPPRSVGSAYEPQSAAATALRSLQSCTSGTPDELRESIRTIYCVLSELHRELTTQQQTRRMERQTTRRGFLLTLANLIGEMPTDRSWQDEWPRLADAIKLIHDEQPRKLTRNASKIRIEDVTDLKEDQIASMVHFGWARDDAETFAVLSAASRPIAQALKEKNTCFAAATHTICHQLYARTHEQSRDGRLPPMLYCHLRGPASLVEEDENWLNLLKADETGFRGLTAMGLVTATNIRQNFTPEGFAIRLKHGLRIYYNVHDATPYVAMDSPVVAFESAPTDAHGAHAAVMTAQHSGHFPPNTLFRLKYMVPKETGFVHAPTGVRVMQQLLVVSATYLPPAAAGGGMGGMGTGGGAHASKFTAPVLSYASREAYVRGLEDEVPSLTMQQEFERDLTWRDWHGTEHTLRDEWGYCNGVASRCEGCTPGTRDEHHEGMTAQDFCERANALVRSRRAAGLGLSRSEDHAFLTLSETVAVRLYSGPSYQPINTYLRQIAHLTGPHRVAITRHAELTFSATVAHLCSAIRKLAAIATQEQAAAPLYRAIRGELPRTFWVLDEHGMVSATDTAFMSTSLDPELATEYMGSGCHNVLWEMRPRPESDTAYHRGADISILAQFAHESEVLFPPFTMLTVLRPSTSMRGATTSARADEQLTDETADQQQPLPTRPDELRDSLTEMKTEHRKTYVRICVMPSFV